MMKNIEFKVYFLLGSIFSIYSILLTRTCPHHSAGMTCISPHLVDDWLRSYENGFAANGLLGQLHSFFIGNTVNLLILNFLAFLLVSTIFTFIYKSLQINSQIEISRIFFLFTLITPFFSIFINTIGSSLQVSLIIFAITIFFIKKIKNDIYKIPITFLSIILMGLINESSLILISPSFIGVFLNPLNKRFLQKAFICSITFFFFIFAFVISTNYHIYSFSNTEILTAYNPLDGRLHTPIELPNLLNSLIYEWEIKFGNPKFIFQLPLKVISVTIVPLLLAFMIGLVRKNYIEALRFYKLLFFTFFYTLPFYLINDLWGSIAIYNLVTTIFIYNLSACIHKTNKKEIKKFQYLEIYWKYFQKNLNNFLLSSSFLIILLYPIHNQSWLRGVPQSNALIAIAILIFGFFYIKKDFKEYSKIFLKNNY